MYRSEGPLKRSLCIKVFRNLNSMTLNKLNYLIAGTILLGSISACGDSVVDPFENDDNYFTVYGFLDQAKVEQSLRLVEVTRRPEIIDSPSDPRAKIDARVFTTDLFSNQKTEWSHELVQFDDGSYGHVFRANIGVRSGATYRLEIVRNDGKMTTAETTVPKVDTAFLFDRGPEIFSSDSSDIYQEILIPGIGTVWDVTAVYSWENWPYHRAWKVLVPYGQAGARTAGGDWLVDLNISDDQVEVRKSIEVVRQRGILESDGVVGLASVGLQFRIPDENWQPPEGIFDPEVLAQPGAVSNVSNGYGLFGSVGLYIERWNAQHLLGPLGYIP
jgi:hypothetical protein